MMHACGLEERAAMDTLVGPEGAWWWFSAAPDAGWHAGGSRQPVGLVCVVRRVGMVCLPAGGRCAGQHCG
jgi:hypothetical protein